MSHGIVLNWGLCNNLLRPNPYVVSKKIKNRNVLIQEAAPFIISQLITLRPPLLARHSNHFDPCNSHLSSGQGFLLFFPQPDAVFFEGNQPFFV